MPSIEKPSLTEKLDIDIKNHASLGDGVSHRKTKVIRKKIVYWEKKQDERFYYVLIIQSKLKESTKRYEWISKSRTIT